ncbi:MAG: hypothetical protein ACK44Q_07625, partial [Pirellulaceae bacterium]
LTRPVGGSRGTRGEGLFFQLRPSRTILPQRTNTVSPPRFVVPSQRPSLRAGDWGLWLPAIPESRQ